MRQLEEEAFQFRFIFPVLHFPETNFSLSLAFLFSFLSPLKICQDFLDNKELSKQITTGPPKMIRRITTTGLK
jgi:hypothetical protein